MKLCTGCGRELPREAFPFRDRSRGLRRTRCRACAARAGAGWYRRNQDRHREHAARSRQQRHAEHRALLATVKAVPCADCGVRYPPYVMDLDHVRGVKRLEVANLAGHRLDLVHEEIEKCEVVCANCHRLRTSSRRRAQRS